MNYTPSTIYVSAIFLITLITPIVSFGLIGNTTDATTESSLIAIAKVNDATGVLIGSKIILTAGHVINFGQIRKADIQISFPHSKFPNEHFEVDDLKSVDHGIFPTRYLDHSGQDLAVIFLKKDVKEFLSIQPIPIYKASDKSLLGKSVTLAGYGRYQIDNKGRCIGPGSDRLKIAKSTVLELLNLPGRWGAPLIIGTPDVSPCDGDSGSPALINIKGIYYVVGIASGPYNPVPNGTHLGRSFQYADMGSALEWFNHVGI